MAGREPAGEGHKTRLPLLYVCQELKRGKFDLVTTIIGAGGGLDNIIKTSMAPFKVRRCAYQRKLVLIGLIRPELHGFYTRVQLVEIVLSALEIPSLII
jgi:hypothetical protein